MSHYVIELLIWIVLAYAIGCVIGWLLRGLFRSASDPVLATVPESPVEPVALRPAAPAAPVAMAVPEVETAVAARPPPPMPIEPEIIAPLPVSAVPGMVRMERPKGLAAARGGAADNLQRISGVGPKNEKVLNTLGIYHFDQIAGWTAKEIAWVDDHIKFNGRIEREEWVAQCKLLAAGEDEEFARRWGTGGLKPGKK
jgi:NADH-quinone oxidoreductase subunit E